jgi:hypothetical protein
MFNDFFRLTNHYLFFSQTDEGRCWRVIIQPNPAANGLRRLQTWAEPCGLYPHEAFVTKVEIGRETR